MSTCLRLVFPFLFIFSYEHVRPNGNYDGLVVNDCRMISQRREVMRCRKNPQFSPPHVYDNNNMCSKELRTHLIFAYSMLQTLGNYIIQTRYRLPNTMFIIIIIVMSSIYHCQFNERESQCDIQLCRVKTMQGYLVISILRVFK
jgi:hypothetical protein